MHENIMPRAGEMIAIKRAIKHTSDLLKARIDFFKDFLSFLDLKKVMTFKESFRENIVIDKAPQRVSTIRRHKKNMRAKKADKKASFFELGS